MQAILDSPLAIAVPALWLIVFLRSNGTYWVGRGMQAGYRKTRKDSAGPTYLRAADLVGRYGAWAVLVCFFTVGLQTAVLVTAGVLRMPLRRFIPATIVGGFFWAMIYATIGMAVFQAAVLAAAGSPWGVAGLALFAGALVVVVMMVRRRHHRSGPQQQEDQAGDRKAVRAEA